MMQDNGFWIAMTRVIPEGQWDGVRVEHVNVSREDALWCAVRGERLSEGPLVRLFVNGAMVMSDGDMERISNTMAVHEAHGSVLIAGLGIGMVLVPILERSGVREVTVLEKERGVIHLVETPLRQFVGPRASRKLTVLEADVSTWEPPEGRRWDCIYLDIWGSVCTDNLPEIAKLKRRYSRLLRRDNPDAWLKVWMERELGSRKRVENREDRQRRAWKRVWLRAE